MSVATAPAAVVTTPPQPVVVNTARTLPSTDDVYGGTVTSPVMTPSISPSEYYSHIEFSFIYRPIFMGFLHTAGHGQKVPIFYLVLTLRDL